MRPLLPFCLAGALAAGCYHHGYQADRSFKAVHIFGIGWIFDKSGTNKVRAFAIGSLDATTISATVNTNAPRTFAPAQKPVAPISIPTNVPTPLGIPLNPP